MRIVARLEDVDFEWDSEKAEFNLEKHGVDFIDAMQVFLDPFVVYLDSHGIEDEPRSAAIGLNYSLNLLLVVHTERDDYIRIISARTPTRHERRLYEER